MNVNLIKNVLKIERNGFYIDCTYGEGKHTMFILKMLGDNGRLFSFDCDNEAILLSSKIKDHRFMIINDNFSSIKQYMNSMNLVGKIHGIIFDLGVSNIQLKNSSRGFSFMKDGPLDMRMNRNIGFSAKYWLNRASKNEIYKVIKNFGEELYAKKIANRIVNYRKYNLLDTTFKLSNLVKSILGYKRKFKHQATRTFQAIRIYINNELFHLKKALNYAYDVLIPGGKLLVISFHSLEDRIVKNFIKNKSNPNCFILPDLPLTNKEILKFYPFKLINLGKFKPSNEDVKKNSRIRSAIIRVAQKI